MPSAAIAEDQHTESKQRRYYRPELDALRFFAFLCVFVLHAGDYLRINPAKHLTSTRALSIGADGVPVFFLLSAFLIAELLFREKDRTGSIHIRSFYVRRILRIWPLYFSAFFGLALLNRFVPGTGTDSPYAWLAFTFLCGNWYIFHHGWIASSVDPLWSISIEEQFYLIIPVLAALAGRRAVFVVSWVFLVTAYVAVLWYAIHPNAIAEWTNSLVQFQFFCVGTLIALSLRGKFLQLSAPVRIRRVRIGISLLVRSRRIDCKDPSCASAISDDLAANTRRHGPLFFVHARNILTPCAVLAFLLRENFVWVIHLSLTDIILRVYDCGKLLGSIRYG